MRAVPRLGPGGQRRRPAPVRPGRAAPAELAPGEPDARFALAEALRRDGQRREARLEYAVVRHLRPDDPRVPPDRMPGPPWRGRRIPERLPILVKIAAIVLVAELLDRLEVAWPIVAAAATVLLVLRAVKWYGLLRIQGRVRGERGRQVRALVELHEELTRQPLRGTI